jgi:GT2 family glycosyltransferase
MPEKVLPPIEIDIVIISYAKNDHLHNQTITGIKTLCKSENATKVKFNAIIVESNKDISYDDMEDLGHNIKTVYCDKEFGYHTYLNHGLKQGNAEWTCLCNNDLVFKPNWATTILQVFTVQREHNPTQFEYLSASPANPKEQWHKANLGKLGIGYGVRQQVAGWCLFQSRNVFEKIGGLEERIKFWFCDNWYSIALQYHKIPHLFIGTSIVEHHNEIEGTTTKDVDLSAAEKHKMTFGAGDEFREIVREMLGDPEWGNPSKETLEQLKKQGKTWY